MGDATLDVLLDREPELGAITSAVTAALGGHGSAVLLRGPAGIGKTSLLRAGAAVAADRGLVVRGARGAELESEFGFGVVRQLFASETASDAHPGLLDHTTALAAAVLGVQPPAHAGRGPDGPDAAYAKLDALTRMATRIAATSGLAVLVDDAHWADGASLRFLTYLARRISAMPAVLIMAARDGTEVGATAVDEVLAGADATILEPGPLSAQAAGRLVRAVVPEAGEATCRACHTATGGNPLFLRELVRTLNDSVGADPVDVLAVVPSSAVEAIRGRLRRLPSPAAGLATAVAVVGDGSLVRHAAAVARIANEDAMLAADDLVRAGILRAERPLRFAHPLLRSAAYELLLPGERAAAHALAADLLSGEDAAPERVAAHLLACDPGGHAHVCQWLRAAAREAMHRGAPDAAATYLTRALDEPPPLEERAEIHLSLGEAQALTRHPGAAAEHLRRGIAGIDDPRRRLQAATLLAGILAMDGRGEDAVGALDAALAHREQADEREVGMVEAHLLNVARHDILTRARCLDLARRLRERARVTRPGSGVELTAAAAEEAMAGDSAERTATLAVGAVEGLEAEGTFPADYTVITAARSLIVADSFGAAERCLNRSLATARAHGATVAAASILGLQCELHQRRGALEAAATCGRESLRTAREGWAIGLPAVSSALGAVLTELDDLDGAEGTIEAALAQSPDSAYATTMLLLARGRLRLARDQPGAALSDLLEVGRRQARAGELNPALMEWRSLAAEALVALGKAAQAAALAEEELQLARRFGAPRALGNALRVVGAIGAHAVGTARLREAVDVLSRSSARLTLAYAQADLGAALRRSSRAGEAGESRIVLRQALDGAHACGGALLQRRALAELRLAGARPRRASLRGVDALTVSERRTADLAALGLSNHEIAGRLVVSVRTVEFHLSGVFRKLGIGSRRELTSVLAGHAEARSAATNLG